ncbi:hypothetical protein BGX28_008733 [Mortierella sp. GBA30]|nr:hypothetical protein BGX28_008733 [Mortierella sp. GBA30]
MKFSAFILASAAVVAPALAAKTYDVNFMNGTFAPQEITISPGDTVRWPNADANHAIVQTNDGARSCTSKSGGFNSGTKLKGQAYQRTFPSAATVNYKDGIGNACAQGAQGTIVIKAGGAPSSSSTMSGSTIATATGTRTAAPISSPTRNGAGFLTPERTVLLGLVGFIGALAL